MENNDSRQRLAVDAEQLNHIATLLARYPEVSIEEGAAILRFLKKAPALDVGLLSAVEKVRPQLDQFRSDHRKDLELGSTHYFWVLLILLAVLGICAWLWDFGL